MARNIELSQIGDYCEDQYEKLLRVTVLVTDRKSKRCKSNRLRKAKSKLADW